MSDQYIPDHILADVLSRLPFDSMIRFRCVSISWRDLIDSNYTTGTHSKRSCLIQTYPHPDSKIIVIAGDQQLYAFDSVVKKGKGIWEAIPKQLSTPPSLTKYCRLAGSCNGILCFSISNGFDDNLLLWNPFTRSYFELPFAPDEFTVHPTSNTFGYDPINDDYKVIRWFRISNIYYENDQLGCRRYELCVYSLKQKSWTAIRDGVPFELPEDYFFGGEGTVSNGAAHWLVPDMKFVHDIDFLVAFDLGTYEFRKLSCRIPRMDPGHTKVRSLNGWLSLVVYPEGHRRASLSGYGVEEVGVVDIWVMKEYGVEASWTKLTSIELDGGQDVLRLEPVPVVFLKKRRKLLLRVNGDHGMLVIYDMKRKSFSEVAIRGDDCRRSLIDCSNYCEATYCVCVGSFVNPGSI